MAVTAFATGTGNGGSALTVTTEHFLSDINESGVFVASVDTNSLVDGDVLEARIYEMVLTGGTSRVLFFAAWYGAQPADDQIKLSYPIANQLTDATALRFSLKQTFGTGRSPTWKILKIA